MAGAMAPGKNTEDFAMKCPNDETTLVMSERQGIEIDYCPTCRGVWLDRGELDKIIERAGAFPGDRERDDDDRRGFDRDVSRAPYPEEAYRGSERYGSSSGHPRKKRKNFLGELFDID